MHGCHDLRFVYKFQLNFLSFKADDRSAKNSINQRAEIFASDCRRLDTVITCTVREGSFHFLVVILVIW